MEIQLRGEGEGACQRMRESQFAQRPDQAESDGGGAEVTQNHTGSGEFHGDGAAEEQARPDRAAEGDHGKLPRRQVPMQPSLALEDRTVSALVRQSYARSSGIGHGRASYQKARSR